MVARTGSHNVLSDQVSDADSFRQATRRMWRGGHLRPSRSLQARLPQPVRAATSRAGIGGHRGLQRRAASTSQSHGPGIRHLHRRRPGPRFPARWPSATPATPPRAIPHCSMPSPSWWSATRARLRWRTTATSPMRTKCTPNLSKQGSIFQTTSDTEVMVHLIARSREQTLVDAMADSLRRIEGAFSLVMLTPDRIFAARDPRGFRPLVMGRISGEAAHRRRHHCLRVRDLRLRPDRRDLRARSQARRIGDRWSGRRSFALLFGAAAAIELHL